MIVFGGGSGSSGTADGASYDPATNTWSPLIAGSPGTRRNHYAFWTGSDMIIWGGGGGSEKAGCIYKP